MILKVRVHTAIIAFGKVIDNLYHIRYYWHDYWRNSHTIQEEEVVEEVAEIVMEEVVAEELLMDHSARGKH